MKARYTVTVTVDTGTAARQEIRAEWLSPEQLADRIASVLGRQLGRTVDVSLGIDVDTMRLTGTGTARAANDGQLLARLTVRSAHPGAIAHPEQANPGRHRPAA